MPHRTSSHSAAHSSTHRRHPAYDSRQEHPGTRSSALATQLMIGAISFSVMIGAAFQALQSALGN